MRRRLAQIACPTEYQCKLLSGQNRQQRPARLQAPLSISWELGRSARKNRTEEIFSEENLCALLGVTESNSFNKVATMHRLLELSRSVFIDGEKIGVDFGRLLV